MNVRTLSIVALLVMLAAAAVFLITPARPRPVSREAAPPAIKDAAPGPHAEVDPPKVEAPDTARYDFTDPDGNADRLFVFHRDVDKARERLRNGDPPAAR